MNKTARLAVAAGLVASLGCSPAAKKVPDPEIVSGPAAATKDHAVRGAMWDMARDVEALNVLLRRSNRLDAADRKEIVDRLDSIAATAHELAKDDAAQRRHPILGENLEAFMRDVDAARVTASMSPPNYYLAGSVAGACTHCHTIGFARRAVSPPVRGSQADELPDTARAILQDRMTRHGLQMTELLWAMLFLEHDAVAELAAEIASEPQIARPLPGRTDEINSWIPPRFFGLQDDLAKYASDLEMAAKRHDDPEMSAAFGRMTRTCVTCHATYFEAIGPKEASSKE